ncbi:serine/threonine-protein kinase [Nonomuraea glycinis]|uniref:serine/threonine-protein kinase n=1 Tax=Nonomuraea glycinis TaxID=2047744 RepID=UPI002E14656B|nr:WD40 repeat domain-containing serine/threonine-protein kinase [Nonomuraea glycinis]
MSSALLAGDPRQLGEFWLAGRLGEGGQGVVYEGYGPSGQRVAIKVLHPGAGAELRRRFAKEVAATRSVSPFCTARVLAVELDAARPFIVSEYVGGPSLRRAVKTGGPYGADELYRLATGIATALTAIHEAGVIHRDLKPDNVLIGPDGPRVIDFGIARTSEMSLTPTGQGAGTPAFMAPESVVGMRAGPPVDVWAWGAVMLFAATGHDPFTGENLAALFQQILAADPDVSMLEEPLRSLVAATMAKDPEARPTARALLLGLVGDLGELGELAEVQALLAEGSRAAGSVRPPAELTPPPLESVAEGIYQRLRSEDQALVPQIMLRMVMPGEGAEDMLRKVRTEELEDGVISPADADRVLAGFARAELVARDGDTLSLANAALLRAWPRMREWIDADRDGLLIHRRLGEAAQRWDEHGRRPVDLYQGTALEAALSWAATGRHHATLNLVENAFLAAGLALSRVRARRRRQVSTVLAVLLAVAVAAAGVAVDQRVAAVRERDTAIARRTAVLAEELRTSQPELARSLSVAAWRVSPVDEGRAALYSSLAQKEVSVVSPPLTSADAVFDLSADGEAEAVADKGRLVLRDLATGAVLRDLGGLGQGVRTIALSHDRSRVAVSGADGVRVLDLATGRTTELLRQQAIDLVFSADDRLLGVNTGDLVGVWPAAGGKPLVRVRDDLADNVVISPDGRLAALVSSDRRYQLWDLRARRRLREPNGGRADGVAFGPAGTVSLSVDGAVRVWDLAAGRFRPGLQAEGMTARWMSYSRDGTMLVASDRASLGVWEVPGTAPLLSYKLADTMSKPLARLSRDRTRIVYLTGRGSVVTLDLGYDLRPLKVARAVAGAAFGPGARIAAVEGEGGLVLWDVARRRALGPLRGGPSSSVLAFSPDGRWLAAGAAHSRQVTLWDVGRRAAAATVRLAHGDSVDGLVFSPDGRTLAASPDEGPAELWDVASRTRLRTLPGDGDRAMAFRPDGGALAIGGLDSALVDLRGDAVVDKPFGGSRDGVRSIAYAGSRVATGFHQFGVDLWNASGGTSQGRLWPDPAEFDSVVALAFDPGGNLLATGGAGGAVRLWDTGRLVPVGDSYRAHVDEVLALAYTDDGHWLRSVGADGTVQSYPIDPGPAVHAVCARTHASLDRAAWQRYIPEIPFREVC